MTEFTEVTKALTNFNIVQLDDIKKKCISLAKPLRSGAKDEAKALMLEERKTKGEANKLAVRVGMVIDCTYKGSAITAKVVGTNPTTISVHFLNKEGGRLVKADEPNKFCTGWKHYWQFELQVDETEV